MKKEELWDIEEKYDVFIKELYGDQRIQDLSQLEAFIILNWQRQSQDPVTMTQINLQEQRHLLKAIMKPSGPFYQDTQGVFQKDELDLNEEAYLSMLSDIKIYVARGGIDFSQLTKLCMDQVI